jgi:hypothetical protein
MDLQGILKTLNQNEKVELAQLLQQDLNAPNIELLKSSINKDQEILCPHCNSNDI